MKKTLQEIKDINQLVGRLYQENESLKKSKFSYAWDKFIKKNYNPTVTEMNEKVADLRIDFALTDPKTKELLYSDDKGSFKYTLEGMKGLNEAYRDLMKEFEGREIEIIPFILKPEDVPALSEEEKEELTGLII